MVNAAQCEGLSEKCQKRALCLNPSSHSVAEISDSSLWMIFQTGSAIPVNHSCMSLNYCLFRCGVVITAGATTMAPSTQYMVYQPAQAQLQQVVQNESILLN